MNFFYKVINSGTDKANDIFLMQKIRNTNFVALLYSLLAMIFVTFSLYYFTILAFLPFLFILFGISVFFFNKAGHFQTSRFIVCFLFSIIYTIWHAYIAPANQEMIGSIFSIQIVFWIVPYLVYDFREIKYLIFYTSLYIITGFSLPSLINILEIENLDISIITHGYLSYIIYGVSISAISGVMLFLKWQMYLSENSNESLLKLLNNKNSDLECQNEEISLQQEEIIAHNELMHEQSNQLFKANILIEEQNKELKLLNDQLEFEGRHRKNELINTYQELITYNHQLEEFAFFSAHNLRSPVARFLGLSNLLNLNLPSTEIENKFILEKMVESANDLDIIIKDLNIILQIRKGINRNMEHLFLEEKLEKVKTILKDEIQLSEASITADFSNAASIMSISNYIESIFYNLISNSIKFRSFSNNLKINLTSEAMGDFVKITITDNGLGIDLEKYKEKLFGLYNRFHTHVKGKGLGLHLVKIQISALRGKIEVNSKINEGTTFTIFLDQRK